MCSNIVPPKLGAVGHPHVNVPDEGVGQIARLMEAAPIQMASHVILSKLQEHGHPGAHHWAAHVNIFVVEVSQDLLVDLLCLILVDTGGHVIVPAMCLTGQLAYSTGASCHGIEVLGPCYEARHTKGCRGRPTVP